MRLGAGLCYAQANKTRHASEGALVPRCAPRRVPLLLIVSPMVWRAMANLANFEKPAISIPEQIDLLGRRGLIVSDVARAERCLELISYYRLRPYWLPFEVPAHHDGDHAFREGAIYGHNPWPPWIPEGQPL